MNQILYKYDLYMANVIEARDGLANKNGKPNEDTENKINEYLNKTKEIFDDEKIERDQYYAFVCSKWRNMA